MAINILSKIALQIETRDLKKAQKDLKDTDKATKGATSGTKKLATALKGVAVAAAAAYGAYKLVDMFAEMGRNAIQFGDALGKTSAKLGITAEELQELRIRADAASVSTAALEVGFQRFTRRLDEARQGQGQLRKTFDELNISLKDNEGNFRSNIDVFQEFGDKVGQIEDASTAVAMTFKAVDTEGVNLINMFRQSAAEQEKLISTAKRYGLVLSNEVVESMEEYATELSLIEEGTKRLAIQRDVALAPLTVAWAEMKNEIAFTTLEVLAFFGAIDENAAMRQMKLERLKEEIGELQDKIANAPQAQDPEAALFQSGDITILQEKLRKKAELEEEIAADEEKRREREKKFNAERSQRQAEQNAAIEAIRKKKEEALELDKEAAELERQAVQRANLRRTFLEETQLMIIQGMDDEFAKADALFEFKMMKLEQERDAYAQTAAEKAEIEQAFNDRVARLEEERAERKKQIAKDEMTALESLIDFHTDAEKQKERWQQAQADWVQQSADAITDFVVTGKGEFKDLAASILRDLARMIIQQQIFNALKSVGFGFASGGIFGGGVPTGGSNARGGAIVSGKRSLAGGGATMSEHGAEAIMPLKRDAQGRLGVSAEGAVGGGGVNVGSVTINIESGGNDDMATAKAAEEGMMRALETAVDNRIARHARSGGMLNPARARGF